MQVWDESFFEDDLEDKEEWAYEILKINLRPLIIHYLYKPGGIRYKNTLKNFNQLANNSNISYV